MSQFLVFVKVTLGFLFNIVGDAIIGVYNFFNAHWAQIMSFSHYVWFNLHLFGHYIFAMLQAKLA